ncbi:Shikimate O-hydroxycinnamoyltransferase [Platanthera guangdongensis]|uniref:Shikimate O-hydroxycinnamoyltransferase n=1 Tax=Platanthera guangdongensis TaxID=2320717 RepID=A0ABR2MDU1_9ASPA
MVEYPPIEIEEKTLVIPNEATPADEIWLSNLDLLVARDHTPTVYFYRRPLGASDFFSPTVIKDALARALVPFYPLAGRLVPGADGRLCIRCTAEGALFIVARSESVLRDFGDFAPSDQIRRLLVPFSDCANEGIQPLVMFQLTFFQCGGVCLGTAVHHTAADGLGALNFINSWASIARITNHNLIPPSFNRTSLRSRSPPSITSTHYEYCHTQPTSSTCHSPFTSIVLRLSNHHLSILRTTTTLSKKPLSTFKAVVVHIWRCACKARGLDSAHLTRLYMTADARSRLHPPLPPNFIGNAIFRMSTELTVGEVVTGNLEFTAAKVSDATARLDNEYVRSLVDFLEARVEDIAVRKGSWVMPETDIWVISWQGLPIYGADFGWGKPLYMGRACLQFSGLLYIVPTSPEEEDGGLLVLAAMEPEKVEKFKEVFYKELGHPVSANL